MDPVPSMVSTGELIGRIQDGDERAREILYARLLPGLRRWARGRLPRSGRALTETDDVVQVALIRSLNRIHEFEPGGPGSFVAYLHRILMNCIRDEFRKVARRPGSDPLPDELPGDRPKLLEETLGVEAFEAYEAALALLPETQREPLILRIEFGFTYGEIAETLGRPSANAVRMQVTRALGRVVELMDARD